MLTLLLVLQGAPQRPAQLTRFLQQSIELDAGQLEAVERGEPIVKVLETRDRRDVAIFGIITTPTSREQHTRAMRDFPTSLRTPNRTQLGIFGNPATEADVAAVTINSRDVAEMKSCKPGDCVVKLPATDMRRIHDEMNWSASPSDLQAQLNAYARRRLVEYVTDYRQRGDSAMAIYDDRGNMNMRASDAFAAQFAESPYIYQTVPSLRNYVTSYPHGALPSGASRPRGNEAPARDRGQSTGGAGGSRPARSPGDRIAVRGRALHGWLVAARPGAAARDGPDRRPGAECRRAGLGWGAREHAPL